LSLVQTSSGAVIFIPCLLDTDGLQLNHTRSMSPSDVELQHHQASVVLPNIHKKYFSIALTFLIFFIYLGLLSNIVALTIWRSSQYYHI
jgi:hypothetical protein